MKSIQFGRREGDKFNVIRNDSPRLSKWKKPVEDSVLRDEYLEEAVGQLASSKTKKVLVGCGKIIGRMKLNIIIAEEYKGSMKNSKQIVNESSVVLGETKKIVDDMIKELSAKDFEVHGAEKEAAMLQVVEYLIEKGERELLKEIALNCRTESISNRAAWGLVRKMDSDALMDIEFGAILQSTRNIAAIGLYRITKGEGKV